MKMLTDSLRQMRRKQASERNRLCEKIDIIDFKPPDNMQMKTPDIHLHNMLITKDRMVLIARVNL